MKSAQPSLRLRPGWRYADTGHALVRCLTARVGDTANSADLHWQTAHAPTRSADLTDDTALITFEACPLNGAARVAGTANLVLLAADAFTGAQPIGWTARVVRTTDIRPLAADALSGAQPLGRAAHTVITRTYLVAITGASDLTAAAVVHDPVAAVLATPALRIRMARLLDVLVVAVWTVGRFDDGGGIFISAAGIGYDRIAVRVAVRDDVGIGVRAEAEGGSESCTQTTQRQPPRSRGAQSLRETVEAFRIHASAGSHATATHPATDMARAGV
jgi:hypothetical protein